MSGSAIFKGFWALIPGGEADYEVYRVDFTQDYFNRRQLVVKHFFKTCAIIYSNKSNNLCKNQTKVKGGVRS
ncbi:MAG: hypothetical protein BGO39_17240 [Chloroflexi bacterium 54-19]|nr:MAG: hypothetical protein BGO39_17240 [Chloroflexi bacterium 54-19]